MRHFYLVVAFILALFFSGCAPKEVNLSTINPQIELLKEKKVAVYDSQDDRILFYHFFQKEGKIVENSWGKMLPFRVEFMDLWVTGLGHDIRRLTNGHAETIKEALLYNASLHTMKTLHVDQKDYILDYEFARDMQMAIDQYEEKMRRYERDRLPLLRR